MDNVERLEKQWNGDYYGHSLAAENIVNAILAPDFEGRVNQVIRDKCAEIEKDPNVYGGDAMWFASEYSAAILDLLARIALGETT